MNEDTNCITCEDNYNRELINNACSCKKGYYQKELNLICLRKFNIIFNINN